MSSINCHLTGDPVFISLFGDYIGSIVSVVSADAGCPAFTAVRLVILLLVVLSLFVDYVDSIVRVIRIDSFALDEAIVGATGYVNEFVLYEI